MHDQPDLFGSGARLPWLPYAPDIVSEDEAQALIDALQRTALAPFQFQGWIGRRLTTSFGWHYDFDKGSFGETAPIPDWLLPLRERAAVFAGLPADALAQVLLIRYDPGAGIGWHKDRPVFEHVIGVSLGNAATMRFRRRRPGGFDRRNALLAARSIYHLSGEIRHEWEHSIAPMDVPRWSITFRSLAGPRKAVQHRPSARE